ncbi:MAG: 5-methyltetrahydrofolate--homocysteine methyltransferase [Ruminococcus sp.]|nr:5-methyltetrahydrofolate--homocysteine methyltransferase [Ruminococcus sp.]MBQ8297853.1 5-methyltetrahydrofolate--homocysteine methyltransferase [Ruminococcus sp.]
MKLNPISKSEAARYMGVRGEPDAQVQELIDRAEETVRSSLAPKYVYREASLRFEERGIYIDGMSAPLTGDAIRKHLSGCTRVVLLAATLTSEADKLIRRAGISGVAEALAADCICSAAIEQVCDRAEEEIFSQLQAPYRTWRFSPGYGDLPLDLQKEILLYLNAARRIGLTVTENSLLIPSKSVTAIIGVSDSFLQKGAKGCAVCSMRETCGIRKNSGCGKN